MIEKKTRETPETLQQSSNLFARAEHLLKVRDVQGAIELYYAAEIAGYSADACAGARWICHMLLGNFEAAWVESDVIALRGNPDPNRFWDGQSVAGRRVLIRCLHGLGDSLQYIRYLPLVREVAKSVAVEAQPALKGLFTECRIADEIITWGDPEPLWDQQIEIVELPRIFRTTVATIPSQTPYLNVNAPARLNGARRRVGLLWASSDYNPARSIPFGLLAKVCGVCDADFFSFQPDPRRADLADCDLRVHDVFAPSGCILETACRLRSMDLLITVDTMLAHLAGALGIPTWTLLPFEADWRWMLHRRDSPWYPTMRLFRQPSPGGWDAVVSDLSREISEVGYDHQVR